MKFSNAAYGNNATICQTAEQRVWNMNAPLSPGLQQVVKK